MKQIAIYVRRSVKDSDVSIEGQIEFIRQYIKQQQFIAPTQVFIDDGYSGYKTTRPQFDLMMNAVYDGIFDCIIVKDLSRFMRNYIEMGHYLEHVFPLLGVRFISILESYDYQKEQIVDLRLDIQLNLLWNEYYIHDLSKKIHTTNLLQQRNGEYILRKVPYGYLLTDQKEVIIDREVVPYVQLIFKWIMEKRSVREMIEQLDQQKAILPNHRKNSRYGQHNCLSKRGCWNESIIYRMAKNEFYTGTYVFNRRNYDCLDYQTTYKPMEQWERIYNHHEAIISYDVFNEIQTFFPYIKRKRKT